MPLRQRTKIQALLPGKGRGGRASRPRSGRSREAAKTGSPRPRAAICSGAGSHDDPDELTTASNAIVDMVHDGKLDEAEQAARDFLVRFPEVHDGYDRLGMVYEARGDKKQAAHYYRQVIDFVRAHPDQYEPGFETTFLRLIQKLDPAPAD